MKGKITHSSSISSKGQVTVPLEIRSRLGLVSGDRVEFVIEGEHTLIRPLRPKTNPFTEYAGILGTFPGGKKEINDWLRDLRSEDESDRK